MSLDLQTLSRQLTILGRSITPEMVVGTRDFIAPYLDSGAASAVSLQRDVAYGPDERQRLDIYTPADGSEAERPLLVFVHGGGFVQGDKSAPGSPYYDNVGRWAVRNGYNAICMTYRLAPQHMFPSAVEDIHEMMEWLQTSAGQYGISARNVFLMGQSAGACHVASYVAFPEVYAPDQHDLQGVILVSGIYHFPTFQIDANCEAYLGVDRSTYQDKSPLKWLVHSELPMLVAVAEQDPDYFQTQSMELMNAYLQRYHTLPPSVFMSGHNHLSAILTLGLELDVLGPQIRQFIDSRVER